MNRIRTVPMMCFFEGINACLAEIN